MSYLGQHYEEPDSQGPFPRALLETMPSTSTPVQPREAEHSRTRGLGAFTGRYISMRLSNGRILHDVLVEQATDTRLRAGGLWLVAGRDFDRAWLPFERGAS